MATLGHMAIDQYGQTYHIGKHPPRKWVLDYFGRRHAERMFVDRRDGTPRHAGYVIAGDWLNIYRVSEWKGGSTHAKTTCDTEVRSRSLHGQEPRMVHFRNYGANEMLQILRDRAWGVPAGRRSSSLACPWARAAWAA